MIKTVLLDLDDTLLGTSTDAFVESYTKGFIRLLVKHHPEVQDRAMDIAKALGRAVVTTTQNLDPTRTNLDVFNEALVAYSDLPLDVLRTVFEKFHNNDYMQIVESTQRVELAPKLL